jgi:hypothetical protein
MNDKWDQTKLYAMADTLRMQLIAHGDKLEAVGTLTWRTPWGTRLQLGDKFEGKVVKGKPHALLRVAGDLWLYASVFAKDDGVLAVLDASKSAVTLPKNIIENYSMARTAFSNAATAVYRRNGRGHWKSLESPEVHNNP